MLAKQKRSFFMEPVSHESQAQQSQSSAFIFDETYKTEFDKHKF